MCGAEMRLGPRSVLRSGDWFRASGGPVWVLGDGRRLPAGERGLLRFVGLAGDLVTAERPGVGVVRVYVGRSRWSPSLGGLLRLRSHRLRRVRRGPVGCGL